MEAELSPQKKPAENNNTSQRLHQHCNSILLVPLQIAHYRP